MTERRKPTSTSSFGVGRRENHDSTAFYDRFPAPELSDAEDVARSHKFATPAVYVKDARHMDDVDSNSVALVVTSPPYFAGKEYEEHLGQGGVPASYIDYLDMLHQVFKECVRTLEPGGRIAVNVANLGRKPYRSLSADVIHLLQDELRLLLRGEVIWRKGKGASGNVAWGSYLSPSNPVLRDLTERIIIASKGRFDRALSSKKRRAENLPYLTGWPETLSANEFADATIDVWSIDPESARRVNHPAPFPIALPTRLINLYTYRDDLVLDPFAGSGTTLVAAVSGARRAVGYDIDPGYAAVARDRVAGALRERAVKRSHEPPSADESDVLFDPGAAPAVAPSPNLGFQQRASFEGKMAQQAAKDRLVNHAGFRLVAEKVKLRESGAMFNLELRDALNRRWLVDVSGAFTVSSRPGLRRTDTVWKSLGRALVLQSDREGGPDVRLLLVTSHLPTRGSEGWKALHAVGPGVIWDVVEMADELGEERLKRYATGEEDRPLSGFWSESDLVES